MAHPRGFAGLLARPAPAGAAATQTDCCPDGRRRRASPRTRTCPTDAAIRRLATRAAFHGLGETARRTRPHVDQQIAATHRPQGYAVLTFDARGPRRVGRARRVDGPREMADVRVLFAWLGARAGRRPHRIGAMGFSYGGGASGARRPRESLRGDRLATAWTDLYAALAPQGWPDGSIARLLAAIAARAQPEVSPSSATRRRPERAG